MNNNNSDISLISSVCIQTLAVKMSIRSWVMVRIESLNIVFSIVKCFNTYCTCKREIYFRKVHLIQNYKESGGRWTYCTHTHVYSASGLEVKVGRAGAQAKLTSMHHRQVCKARGLRVTCEKKDGSRLSSCLSLKDIWHVSIGPLILILHTNTSTSVWTLLCARPRWVKCVSVSIKQTSTQ